METLLHYVWKHKLFVSDSLKTTDGETLEIIDPGIYNTHAGPDFFNAKLKLKDKIWAGNVEIHSCSSEWYKHKHDSDKAYNSVILHVIESADEEKVYNELGDLIPQWILTIPEHIKENYVYLLSRDDFIPCIDRIHEIPEIYWMDWKETLLMERLEKKVNAINQLLKEYKNDWKEVFYITLARNFGFGINNDAFERLAKSLPLKYILKHSNFPNQIEALFLGQAGLLENENLDDSYYLSLQKEYSFLSKKYKLQKLDAHIFKSLRIRPNNFPHIKLVQLAGFIGQKQSLFSKILETKQLSDFQMLFYSSVGEYWKTHYHFEKTSPKKEKGLGLSAINIVLINTVAPILYAYGKNKNKENFVEKSLELLSSIKSENNYIVNSFVRVGVNVTHAGDSQALIQLKKEYCELKKCIFCRIGHKLLSKTNKTL
jgi:hypothetical protein